MSYETNRPSQLEKKRKEHYDEMYARQPVLMRRLNPFLNKSDIIEEYSEPLLRSPKDPLSINLVEPTLNGKVDNRKVFRKKMNKFTHSIKLSKESSSKKISEVRPDVLWNLK